MTRHSKMPAVDMDDHVKRLFTGQTLDGAIERTRVKTLDEFVQEAKT